jgi:hypothetical protein
MKKAFYIILCIAPSFLYSMETSKGKKIILELSKSKGTGKSQNFLPLTKSGLTVVAGGESVDCHGKVNNKRISPTERVKNDPYTQFKAEENFGLNKGKK